MTIKKLTRYSPSLAVEYGNNILLSASFDNNKTSSCSLNVLITNNDYYIGTVFDIDQNKFLMGDNTREPLKLFVAFEK